MERGKLARITGDIWIKSEWPNLIRHIWGFPKKEAILYIDKTLSQIDAILGMGDSIFKSLKHEIIENALSDWETGEPLDYDNREESIKNANYFLQATKTELQIIRSKLIAQGAASVKADKDKIKIDLSLDELATFFRLMEEAKIIPLKYRVKIGQMVVENMTTKGVESLVRADSISNKMVDSNMDYKVLEKIKTLLIDMVNKATSLQQK